MINLDWSANWETSRFAGSSNCRHLVRWLVYSNNSSSDIHLKAYSGCGPIGLITAAVAHAYSAKKIIAFDNNPKRVEFARNYISPITGRPIIDQVFLNTDLPTTPATPTGASGATKGLFGKIGEAGSGAGIGDGEQEVNGAANHEDHDEITTGDIMWEAAKVRAAKWIEEAGLTNEEGVDRVIEATGAQDCGLLGVAIAKQGAVCKYHSHANYIQLTIG